MADPSKEKVISELVQEHVLFVLESDLTPRFPHLRQGVQVRAGEVWWIYRDGVLFKQLEPGYHVLWNTFWHRWIVQRVSLRIQHLSFTISGRIKGPALPMNISAGTSIDQGCNVSVHLELACKIIDVGLFLGYRSPLSVFGASLRNYIVEAISKLPYDQYDKWASKLRDHVKEDWLRSSDNPERRIGLTVEEVYVTGFHPETTHDRTVLGVYQLVERARRELLEAQSNRQYDTESDQPFVGTENVRSLLALQNSPVGKALLVYDADLRKLMVEAGLLPAIERHLKVFLCHTSNEQSTIELYQRLQADYITPWLEEVDLLPGQDRQREITKVVHNSDAVIVCLSQNSLDEAGNIQREVEVVLNMTDELSKDSVLILPLRLEVCKIPERLERWQVVNLFDDQGYDLLLRALNRRADNILSDYYWETSQELLKKTLFGQGVVKPSVFPGVPITFVDGLLKRYMQEHPYSDLEYRESSHSLHLRTADVVRRIENLLEPIIQGIASDRLKDNIWEFEGHMEKVLYEFSSCVGLTMVKKQNSRGFAAFLMETEMAFESIRIPSQLPFLASPDHDFSDEILERFRRLLFSTDVGAVTQVAILILFCDSHKLDQAKQRINNKVANVHARDTVIINHENLLEIVSAKEPENMLRHCILSQMNLVSVAPYTVAGPTPSNFFFGREHELREIADHLATKSYILIGGRLIGKTSILNRLHCSRLPEYGFRTLLFDCSTISTYTTFLSTSIRDWKPEPPTHVPLTFGDLLLCPPDDKPLVLLLDEADKFVPDDRKNGWQLFNTLRALINSSHIQVVLSGELILRDALKDPASPLFNFANLMLLGPLDYSAIEELVTRPMKQLGILIANPVAVVDHIYEFTSGHPNIVQRLCRRLIEQLNDSDSRRITLDDVRTVIENPYFQEYDFLQTYWEGATILEKIISLVLSNDAKVYRLREVQQLLFKRTHIQISAGDVKDTLDRLVELRSILKHTPDGYEFAVKAFPLVLGNTTTVEDLLEVQVEKYNRLEYQV